MLTAAMEALTDSCLSESWNVYGAYAGLFAMLAALAMHLIEFLAHARYHTPAHSVRTNNQIETIKIREGGSRTISRVGVLPMPTPVPEASGHQHGLIFQDDAQRHKVSTYLLEFGIALHSVLIGVALGTNTNEFVALFIALCFHQFFEGMALGAQIARLQRVSFLKAMLMVLFFAVTTPIGVAIGIGIHSGTYNPKSVASLLVNGILDSLSAGILIYVALVNLIAAEISVNAPDFIGLKKRLKFLYFLALYLGAGAMAVVGRWA